MAAALAAALATAPSLRGEAVGDRTATRQFWEEIPASASTTLPREIKDDYWHGQFQRVNREVAGAEQPGIVFFGDSITWNWSLGARTGTAVWNERYAGLHAINMGNSGDITPVMLYRVTHGNLDFAAAQQPKVAVLLCGTNNFVVTRSAGGEVEWDLGADCPPEEVAAGVRAIAQVFRRRLPRTRVIMMGILPVANERKWTQCRQVNAINATFASNHGEVVFVDLQNLFLRADGSLDRRLFTDGTHLTPEGYREWAGGIAPLVADMMKSPPLDPVRIMCVGDAVTEGRDSSGCYRRYLDGILRRQGHLIDFVGTRTRHHDNRVEPDSYEFDPDHEGHWGRDSAWLAEHLPGLLARTTPDVTVIHLGTTEVVAGAAHAGPLTEEITGNISRVINVLRANNPHAKIVLAKIIPVRGKAEAVAMLNNKIARLGAVRSTKDSPVVVADLPA
jgi:lysophospholipase L1-like esterase